MAQTTTQAVVRLSPLAALATRLNSEPNKLLDTLKGTVFREAKTNEQLMALCIVANEYQLNPFTRQIYAFPDKGGGIQPVVSVDGWIAMMNRQPSFDGIEFENNDADGKPVSCTARIFIKNRTRPVQVTEYISECSRNTEPWRQYPRRMLRHKAMIQAARLAFGFSGVYDEDEAQTVASGYENAKPARPLFATALHPAAVTIPTPTTVPIYNTPPTAEQDPEVVEDNIPMMFDGGPDAPTGQPELTKLQAQFMDIIAKGGFTFAQWRDWAIELGMKSADSMGDFHDVPDVVCGQMLKGGIVDELKKRVAELKAMEVK